jgi:uncharacterized protein (TIGR00255 family)
MTVRSMTGYGSAHFSFQGEAFSAEVRAVNHKNLDIRVRMPRLLVAMERKVVGWVRERVVRGHVDVHINVMPGGSGGADVRVNANRLEVFRAVWSQLAGGEDSTGAAPVAWLAEQDGVLEAASREIDEELAVLELRSGVDAALEELDITRITEGAALADDLLGRTEALKSILGQMEEHAPEVLEAGRARLRNRLAEVIPGGDAGVDVGRLEAELLILSDRSDITEEMVRAEAHLKQLGELLRGGGTEACGKRLTFLVQELLRELNTMAAKANHTALSSLTVDGRVEIERIREQVMNIE